jgi:hypothetical protein
MEDTAQSTFPTPSSLNEEGLILETIDMLAQFIIDDINKLYNKFDEE